MGRRSSVGRTVTLPAHRPGQAAGFTYVGLLIAIVILGFGLAEVGIIWRTQAQREREQELLAIGHEFTRAITSYYSSGPHQFPLAIADLLDDKRFAEPKHHLRKLYVDPMTGKADWTIISAPLQGISGVASSSQLEPIKKAGFDVDEDAFKDAATYSDWRFIFLPRIRLRHSGPVTPPAE